MIFAKEFVNNNMKKIEMVLEFLIKFNLLAIPMYLVIFSNARFYPMQTLLTDIVYYIFQILGYSVEKYGIIISFIGVQFATEIVIDMDCTAWKSMYALVALMIASPVKNDNKKLKYIILGLVLIFVLNIFRIVSTVAIAHSFGAQYLDVVHTVLWREGMILAVLVVWFVWLKRQKIISLKHKLFLERFASE